MTKTMSKPLIWLVIPCYNEEAVLPITIPLFLSKLELLIRAEIISNESRICLVNDGSTDATWNVINNLAAEHPRVIGVSLANNVGHQNALLCGLMTARGQCDAAISLDCDGQDDINVIDKMIDRFIDGDEIVYGVRNDRSTDTAFKRHSANLFYKTMNALGAHTINNHADYRLMSSRALDALSEYKEVNLFLRGIVPQIGMKHSFVEYERFERKAGTSHYPLRKMLSLALDGITSFSAQPLRFVSLLGVLFSFIGLVGIIWAIVSSFMGLTIAGWASTIVIICLIGGIQLLSIGVIGEYISRIYLESKNRPRYIVSDVTWRNSERIYRG